jgi:hypothetical protein
VNTAWGWVRSFAKFWYDFLIGDDWTIAAGVVVTLLATYGLVEAGIPAWWLTPAAAVIVLGLSIVRANRRA